MLIAWYVILAIRSFCCKGYCSELGHLLKPAVANRRSLQLPLPFIVRIALPFFPPASRNVRSIRSQDELTRIKMWKKRARPANIVAYVSGNRLLRVPRWKKKKKKRMKGTEKRGVHYVCISDDFCFPRAIIMHVVSVYCTHIAIYFYSMEMLDVKPRRTTLVSKWRHK